VADAALPAVELALPARPEHGDITTNAAMVSAKRAGRPPRELAAALGERWQAGPGAALCERVEVAGPGFLNLFLDAAWYRGALERMRAAGPDFGRDALPHDERLKMNVEFVSVNPTGPLHVGHARYASYGDALCRIFAFVGHDVTREFYVNDYGTQMLRFGQSLAARYGQRLDLDTPVPEEGYQGEYLLDLADDLIAAVGDRYRAAVATAAPDVTALAADALAAIKEWGRDAILAQFRVTLERLRVPFDVWAHESSLYAGAGEHRGFAGEVGKALADQDGEVGAWALAALAGHPLLYDEEGAVWLKTTRYGDDKDRVLIRSSGDPTYFLSDIAYHRDKMDRGFAHMIDVWGADHHGYVPRMKAAFTALPPHDPDRLELIIGQLVNLLESGAVKRMSKRKGDIVTVADLLDAIGVDAARFLLVGRSHDTTLELDIDLAREQSNKNPVYYVQYAHARICSILRNLEGAGEGPAGEALPAVSVDDHERSLVRALARYPDVLLAASGQRAPHRVHTYLGELAAEFHVFYRHCRVLSDDPDTTRFRAALCEATRDTLASGLALLGVSASESM
jgi:arginyl-tRNA synthetase